MTRRTIVGLLLAALVLSLAPANVSARSKVKVLKLRLEPDKKNKDDDSLAHYRMVISTETTPDKTKLQLTDAGDEKLPPLEADKLVPFTETNETLLLVVLVQGDVGWMGNPDEEIEGAWKFISPALGKLAEAAPPGSSAHLLVYNSSVTSWRGEPSDMGAGLPAQRAYAEETEAHLFNALSEARNILRKGSADVKALVIIGDGVDSTTSDPAQAKKLKGSIKDTGATIYSIYHKELEIEGDGGEGLLRTLSEKNAHSTQGQGTSLSARASDIAGSISGRYHVLFKAQHFGKSDKGKRELSLLIDGQEVGDSHEVSTVKPVRKPGGGGSLWWLWLLLILLVVGIIIIVLVRRANNREPPPPPEEEVEPMPQHTVMLGVGGTDDGVPIVGWVVPMGGQCQYQTFKLLQGVTIVGTGDEAHINIGDEFMSTEHAEIVCNPGGFTLNDKGSTNGTWVNEKRISSHELVDNDTFTLGKTDFKFKSIN